MQVMINVQRSSQFLFYFRSHWRPEHPPRVGEERNLRKLALTPKFGKRKYRKKSQKKGKKLIFHTHTHTHTYTCKYVFRRREEKSSYTLPFTLLYNIGIIVVVVIIHARDARKSECRQQWPCRYAWSGRNCCFHQRLDLPVAVVLGPRWLPNHTRRTTKCVSLRPSAYLLLLHLLLLLAVATNMAIRMKTKLGGFGSLLTTIAMSHFKHCQNFQCIWCAP
jgi:hypothetical protein